MNKVNNKNNNYSAIKKFCSRHRVSYITRKIFNSWLLLAALLLGIGTILSISFYFFPWTALPVIFDVAVIVTGSLCILALIKLTIVNKPSLSNIASILEKLVDKKHQYLSIALELGRTLSSTSSQLVEQVCSEAKKTFGIYPKSIKNVVSKKRIFALCICLILFFGSVYICKPRMVTWWDIPLSMFKSIQASVYPGKIAVPKNANVSLRCMPEEPAYPSAGLSITELSQYGARSMRHLLRPGPDGSFTYTIDSIAASVAYAFTLGNRVFGPETVTVVPPPVLYSFKVRLKPPAYTRRKETQLPEGRGSIAAYAGTRAQFHIGSVFPLRSASYMHESGDTVSLDIVEGNAKGEVRLFKSGRYTFVLEDTMMQKSDSLPSFYMSILPDYKPDVRIVKPGINKMLTPAQQETLWVEAVDDFGIKKLSLHWELSRDDIDTLYSKSILPKGKREKLIRRQVAWNLAELSLYPGDTVFYWVYTRDNKPFGKPQVSVSDTFFFRLPTFQEIHKRIAGKEDDASSAMSSVKKLQKDMKERLESLIRSAKGKESLSWEEKKIVEDLGKSIRQQADSLDKAVKALQEAVEKMKQSSVNNEVLDKMSEVQKALKELIDKYGDSLFFNMPGPDEKISWRDMQKAVEKMTEILPDLQEHLENALKYLEMLKKENERALLAQQAKKLAEEQMRIAQSDESEDKRAHQQKDFLDRTGEFLDELRDKLTDKKSPVGMNDIPSSKQVQSLQKSMQSGMQMQRMPMNSTMNQMSANLQSLSGELESTLMSAMFAKAMKDREALLDMAQDAIDLSGWQDGLAQSMEKPSAWKKRKKMTAMEQQALRDALKKSMGNLDSLEIVSPGMIQKIMKDADNALSSMQNVLKSMSSSRPGMGMDKSTHSLNALAQTLLESANSIQQSMSGGSGGGGGMMCGLKKLSAKQAAINSLTGEMLRQMFSQSGKEGGMSKGGKGTKAGRDAENARLAAQKAQKQLADQLEELREKYGSSSEKSLSKRVEELEEEARRITQMLKQPMPDVADRQDRFLVRLLQTTLSMHKREDRGKEERKSKSAVSIYSTEPIGAYSDTFDKTDTFYRLRMKALDGNFPDAYRSSIQKYFDSLGELFLREK